MTNQSWNRETLSELEQRLAAGDASVFDAYGNRDGLYSTVEALGTSDDPELRGYVMDILFHLDRDRAFGHLQSRLSDENEYIRGGALELLGNFGKRGTSSFLFSLQHDASPDVRSTAAAILGYVGSDEVIPALQQAAEGDHAVDRDSCTVCSAARVAIDQIWARG